VIEQMEMLSAFSSVLHVPCLSTSEHVSKVLEESDAFDAMMIAEIARKTQGKRYFLASDLKHKNAYQILLPFFVLSTCFYSFLHLSRFCIGIKKLLSLIDWARETDPQSRVMKFICKLEEEGELSI
jgi:vesicle-fusing ATPase